MSIEFDFSEYRNSLADSFGGVRNSYKWLAIACASLVVFAFQSEPYKGSRQYLNDLMVKKVEVDRYTGWIDGIRTVMDATQNMALGESISEAYNEKAHALADLYFLITNSEEDIDNVIGEIAKWGDGKISEERIEDMLTKELSKQYEFGVSTGLKVPFFDFIIERERFPSFASAIVVAIQLLVLISVATFSGSVNRFIRAAGDSNELRKAMDVIAIRWLAIFVGDSPKANNIASLLVCSTHAIPVILVAYAVFYYWSGSAMVAKGVMFICLLLAGLASIFCSVIWIRLGESMRRLS